MGRMKIFAIAAVLSLTLGSEAFAFCFEEAGAEYGINAQILRAIAKVESNFNPRAFNRNTNGTFDIGLMQINSSWAQALGKERWNSLGEACSNTKAGAWILSQCMEKYGYTWKAIGCYHSQTPDKRDRYARQVFQQLQRVKPVSQEAAYTPIKQKLEDLVKGKVDDWVAGAVQGKGEEFVVQVPAGFGTVPKQPPREPAVQTDPALQSALPGADASQYASSLGPAPENSSTADSAAAQLPGINQ